MVDKVLDFIADAFHWRMHFKRIKDAHGLEKKKAAGIFVASIITTIVLLPLYILYLIVDEIYFFIYFLFGETADASTIAKIFIALLFESVILFFMYENIL